MIDFVRVYFVEFGCYVQDDFVDSKELLYMLLRPLNAFEDL